MPRSGPLSPAPGCVLGRAHTFSVWALPASCPGLVLATQNIDGITGRGTSRTHCRARPPGAPGNGQPAERAELTRSCETTEWHETWSRFRAHAGVGALALPGQVAPRR